MKENLIEQKEQLLSLRENYKQVLLGEVKELKTDIIQTKNWVLLAGGAVIIVYVGIKALASIFSFFSNESTNNEKVREIIIEKPYQVHDKKNIDINYFISPIINLIKQEIQLFLLDIAKKALKEFISKMQQKDINKVL